MRKILLLLTISTLMIMSCTTKNDKTNPFLSEFNTPYFVPDFDNIKIEHYMPAFTEGMKQQKAEIEAITSNTEAPTFENTILALDNSGEVLNRVSRVFFNIKEANTNDEMQKIAREVSPLLSSHSDEISMNKELFERIKVIYENRNNSNLDDQQIRVVEKYYSDFVRGGANLNAEDQEKLTKINKELSTLTINFGENQLAETNNFKLIIDNEADLAGLPENVIATAAKTATDLGEDGKWIFTTSKPSMIPFLQYAENRDLRQKLYTAYYMRGDNNNEFDNKEIVSKIVKLRAEKAKIMGYKNFAEYRLEINMAQNPDNVDKFLENIWTAALPVAKKELKEMQAIADREGNNIKIESWDWWYYAEKLRNEKYNFDEKEIIPYLSIDNVKNGIFILSNKLYGITFEQRTDLPKYHPDVEVFEIKNADSTHAGIIYFDYFPRSSKSTGAWCTSFAPQQWKDGKRVEPVISIVCNFTPPVGDTPALLTWDETATLFHEFGHALHGLFTEGKYKRTAGKVSRDYVELPSQILENWAGTAELLKQYAVHYQTGEIIPDEIIEKLHNSSLFNQGFNTVENIAACILDMSYHKVEDATQDINVTEFENQVMQKIGLIPEILPRYRSTYFSHIFDGGYASGYYVYMWAAVLDADAFDYFVQSGDVFNPELAASFKKHCLAECGNDEGMVQYVKFRGQEPSIDPLLKRNGLK
ncbi:MAG: M3 family metallopeptidase [Lentimicrobiaceae bacterium]|nr:M3 family metallopeptidase [Lentimicrobiaceae bacterium]